MLRLSRLSLKSVEEILKGFKIHLNKFPILEMFKENLKANPSSMKFREDVEVFSRRRRKFREDVIII